MCVPSPLLSGFCFDMAPGYELLLCLRQCNLLYLFIIVKMRNILFFFNTLTFVPLFTMGLSISFLLCVSPRHDKTKQLKKKASLRVFTVLHNQQQSVWLCKRFCRPALSLETERPWTSSAGALWRMCHSPTAVKRQWRTAGRFCEVLFTNWFSERNALKISLNLIVASEAIWPPVVCLHLRLHLK